MVKTVGSLGGFLGPYAIGLLANADNDYVSSMALLASCMIVGGVLCVVFPSREEGKHVTQRWILLLRASSYCHDSA